MLETMCEQLGESVSQLNLMRVGNGLTNTSLTSEQTKISGAAKNELRQEADDSQKGFSQIQLEKLLNDQGPQDS